MLHLTHGTPHPQGNAVNYLRQRQATLREQAAALRTHAVHLSWQWQVWQCPLCSAQHTFVVLCSGLAATGSNTVPSPRHSVSAH